MIASVEKGYGHRNAVFKAVCAASCVGREYHDLAEEEIVNCGLCRPQYKKTNALTPPACR